MHTSHGPRLPVCYGQMRGAQFIAVIAVVGAGCGFNTSGQSGPGDDAGVTDGRGSDSGVDGMTSGLRCPATYGPIVGLSTTSRYRFVSAQATWISAEQACEADGLSLINGSATHLIVLDDVAERAAMIGGLAGGGSISDQWLGATDLAQEGTPQYVTAQVMTLSLNPSMQADNHDCIRLKSAGTYEYRSCDEDNKYVCECDGVPAEPTRFPNPPDGNGNN